MSEGRLFVCLFLFCHSKISLGDYPSAPTWFHNVSAYYCGEVIEY